MRLALIFFLFYMTFDWFKLAPKAMPVQLGEKKLPDQVIVIGHYVAWAWYPLSCSGWRGSFDMTIAKKSVVWGLFAAGGTIAAFVFPVLIALFLFIALGKVPEGLQFENIHNFATNGLGKICLFVVISSLCGMLHIA